MLSNFLCENQKPRYFAGSASTARACAPPARQCGCAGMTDLGRDLERHADVAVLDGVACGVSLAESWVRLGSKTSKRNTYAAPLAKAYGGEFKRLSPKSRRYHANLTRHHLRSIRARTGGWQLHQRPQASLRRVERF
jgi:hypothetical protein